MQETAIEPKRVQRKRVKGYKMPENTVSVTRPGRWGNPFKVGGIYKISSIGWMQPCTEQAIKEAKLNPAYTRCETTKDCVDLFRKYHEGLLYPFSYKDLKGKNLACFCKEGEVCHADVLLELANK